jgi:hypothetical protein
MSSVADADGMSSLREATGEIRTLELPETEAICRSRQLVDAWISDRFLHAKSTKAGSLKLWADIQRARRFIAPNIGGGGCQLPKPIYRDLNGHLIDWANRVHRFSLR